MTVIWKKIKDIAFKRGTLAKILAAGLEPAEPAVIWDDPAQPRLAIGDRDGVPREVLGKAHSHDAADISGMETVLAGKAEVVHGHEIADVDGLETALEGKADTDHAHEIADVSGLTEALAAAGGGSGLDDNNVLHMPIVATVPGGVAGEAQLYYVDTGLINQVPVMTSDSAPAGVASASSIWGTGREAYRAFDGNDSTFWGMNTSGLIAWLQYQFPVGKCITAYAVYPYSNFNLTMKTWLFQGSNDGSNWTTLDTKTGITSWAAGVYTQFNVSNTVSYLRYRLYISDVNTTGSTDLLIRGFKLLAGDIGIYVKLPDGTAKKLSWS